MADEQTPAPGTTTETTTENGGGKTPGSDIGDKKTFTQDEVNAIVGERAKRSAEAAVNKLLESIGVKSPDELKTTLEEKRKRDEAELSESQKKDKELAKMKADHDAAQLELQKERDARKVEKVDNAIIAAAKGAHNPKLVVSMLRDEQSDALTKALKEDGTVDTAAIDKLIADLRKKEGYLFGGQTPGSPSNNGGKAPEPDAKAKEEARKALKRQIKSF